MELFTKVCEWLDGVTVPSIGSGEIVLEKTGEEARNRLTADAVRCCDLRSAFPREVIDSAQRYVVRRAEFDGYYWHLFTAYDQAGRIIGQVKEYGY